MLACPICAALPVAMQAADPQLTPLRLRQMRGKAGTLAKHHNSCLQAQLDAQIWQNVTCRCRALRKLK